MHPTTFTPRSSPTRKRYPRPHWGRLTHLWRDHSMRKNRRLLLFNLHCNLNRSFCRKLLGLLLLGVLLWGLLPALTLAAQNDNTTALELKSEQPPIDDKEALQERISQGVHDFLAQQTSTMGISADISVNPVRTKNLDPCDDFEVYSRGSAQLRARMTVSVRCLGPAKWVTHVHAELSASGFYFVANRTIEAGEPVELDDLIAHETDILKVSPHVLTDPSKIIGHIATRRIPNGSTLRANTLRNPQSVARGQTVQTVARGQGFVVSSEGQAMQSGNPGSRIQVRTNSGQVIQGIVLDAHTVEVILF